jgi:hypothetical protein
MASTALLNAAKIVIGDLDTSVLCAGEILGLQSGTLVNPGLSFFGGTPQGGVARAAVMIGPPVAVPGLGALPASLEVTAMSNFLGNSNIFGVATNNGLSVNNGASFNNGFVQTLGVNIDQGIKIQNALNFSAGFGYNVQPFTCASAITATSIISASGKAFDIQHPTKEGQRLRYVSLEGPECGVYVRGKQKEKIILLPDYWTGLVHEETITAHLTPYGKTKCLYVLEIKDNQIYVEYEEDELEFSYYITAERKDVNRLVVEYEGLSLHDYPEEFED